MHRLLYLASSSFSTRVRRMLHVLHVYLSLSTIFRRGGRANRESNRTNVPSFHATEEESGRRKMAARRKREMREREREIFRAKGEKYMGTTTTRTTTTTTTTTCRARVSSRALDLITKVTRCSTTTLKGIKSCRWALRFSHTAETLRISATINASSVTAMILMRLSFSKSSRR